MTYRNSSKRQPRRKNNSKRTSRSRTVRRPQSKRDLGRQLRVEPLEERRLLAITDLTSSIVNRSFEDDVLADGTFTNNVLTGWSSTPSGANSFGAFNPQAADTTGVDYSVNVPDGVNVGYSTTPMVQQMVTNATTNTLYELTVQVGDRLVTGPDPYDIELYEDTNLLGGVDEGDFPLVDGQFVLATLYATNTTGTGPLSISFDSPQINVDNFTLRAMDLEINTGGGNNVIEVGLNAGNLEVLVDSTPVLDAPLDAVPFLTINGEGGDDTLIVDFAGGDPIPMGGITFNGGESASDNDELQVINGAVTDLHYTPDPSGGDDNAGTLDLDGSTITFTGLEPVLVTTTLTDVTVDISSLGAPEIVTFSDDGGVAGNSLVTFANNAAEDLSFANPTNSLSLLGNDLGNEVVLNSLDAAFDAAITLTGGDGDDTFTINDQTGSFPVSIDGGTETTNDVLTVNANNEDVTLDLAAGIIVGSDPTIQFMEIELINVDDANEFIGSGTPAAEEAFVTGNSDADYNSTLLLDQTVDGISAPLLTLNIDSATMSLLGLGGNDRAEINEVIDGLPTFSGQATLGHANQSFLDDSGLTAADVGLFIDGGADSDTVGIRLVNNYDVSYYSDVVDPNSGNIAIGTSLGIAFAGMEPIDFLGGGAGSTLTLDATVTPGTTVLFIDDDVNFGGPYDALFGAAAANNGVTAVWGNGGFETSRFANFGEVTVVGGDGGETITLQGLDVGNANPLATLNLDGDNTTGTDTAGDTIVVQTLPAAVTANLFGGAGNDLFVVSGATNSLDGVLGDVNVNGEANNAGFNSRSVTAKTTTVTVTVDAGDLLQIDDSGDADPNTYTLGDGTFTRSGTGNLTYATVERVELTASSTAANDIDVVDTTDAIYTVVTGGNVVDMIDVTTTGDGSILEVNAGTGNDFITIATTGAGSVTVANGQAGEDTLTLTDSGAGSGVQLLGDTDGDTFFISDTGDNSVTNVDGNGGMDEINVAATGAGSFMDILAGGNDDTINIGTSLDLILGSICVFGEGSTDTLNISDEADTDDNNYVIRPASVERTDVGPPVVLIEYFTTETLNLRGGTGSDKFVAEPSPDTEYFFDGFTPTGPYGSTPGDTLSVNTVGFGPINAPFQQTAGTISSPGGAFMPINFTDFEWVVLPDRFEYNDNANGFPDPNIADLSVTLGSLPEITIDRLSIHGPDDPTTPNVVEDTDFFEYTAHSTGKLIVRTLFEHEFGDLELTILDENGDIIANSDSSSDADDFEELIIPVVGQEVYYIQVNGVNAAGDDCNVNNYDLEIENFPAPTPDLPDLVAGSDSGWFNDDNVTNVNTPTIEVQADLADFGAMGIPIDQGPGTPGAEVMLAATNQATGAVTTVMANRVDPGTPNNNLWTATFGVLGDGEYFITAWVRIEDGATPPVFNRGLLSEPLRITIDTDAPAAPSTPDMLTASDTGASQTDNITSINQPAFDGTGEANTKVRLFAGGEQVGDTIVTTSGNWEITSEPLRPADHNITAQLEDLAGNPSPISGALAITVDNVLPQRPTIDLVNTGDTGLSEFDNITIGDLTTPLGQGVVQYRITGDPGERFVVKDGNVEINTLAGVTLPDGDIIPADGDTVITIDYNALSAAPAAGTGYPAEGPHPMSVETFDVAGNFTQSEELLVEIDNTAPAVATIGLAPYSDTGTPGDGITSKMQPAFVGTAEANARIHVFADGVLIGTALVQSDESDGTPDNGLGLWELTSEPLADDDYDITAVVEDVAGNVGAATDALELTIDGLGPQRPTIDLVNVGDTGWSEFDNITIGDLTTPLGQGVVQYRITGDPGERFVVKDGNIEINTLAGVTLPDGDVIPADGDTVITIDYNALSAAPAAGTGYAAEGPHPMSVELIDAAGNVSAQSEELLVEIDFTAPATSVPTLQGFSDTNLVDGITSKMQPAFFGTAEANSRVHVFANGELVGTAVAQSDESDGDPSNGLGIWELTSEPLRDGDYDITTQVEDIAGNFSDESDELEITVDGTPPQIPTIDLLNSDDTGWSDMDNVTTGDPAGPTPESAVFRISAETGTTVVIKDGETVIDTFVFDMAFDLTDGTVNGFGLRTIDFDANEGTFGIPSEGPHPLTVEATDTAGNRTQGEQLLVEIDVTAPADGAISVDLAVTSDTGVVGDGATALPNPVFTGTAEANAKIRLYATDNAGNRELIASGFVGSDESDVSIGGTISDDTGIWSLVAGPLANGIYVIDVEVEDKAGNVTGASDTTTVIIDPYEVNDTIATATVLGSKAKITLQDVNLHDTTDVDYFQITAPYSGKLIINAYFVDASGDVNIRVLDASGDEIDVSNTTTDDEQIIIPVVNQEDYYLEVTLADDPDNLGNLYDLEIETFAAPVPSAVVLDPNDDSGMMNNDLITFVDDARLYIIADLADFGAMGIDILDPTEVAANEPGAAVELFANGESLGYATPFGTANTLFSFEFDPTMVANGAFSETIPITGGTAVAAANQGYFNIITASVRIFDGQDTQQSGRGTMSESLNVHFDPNAPDITLATIDMLTASDSGHTDNDNITNIARPAFQGVGEENTKIRLFANGELVGQSVVNSDNSDGVANDGLGLWEITVEPLADGDYDITIELEDIAGNVSARSAVLLTITVDTLEPQRPTIDLVGVDVIDDDKLGNAPIPSDTGLNTMDNNTRGFARDETEGTADVQVRISGEPGGVIVVKDGEDVIDTFEMPSTITTTVELSGLQSVPQNASAGTGTVTITLDTITHDFTWDVSFSGLTGDFTASPGVHFHGPAPTGATAPIEVDITGSITPSAGGTAGSGNGATVLSSEQITDLLAGQWYLNVHSDQFLMGEIRGQILLSPANDFVFRTLTLDEDPHPLSVEVFDWAGNRSHQSEELLVTIDITAPDPSTAPDLLASSDSGMVDTDNVTNVNAPAFRGIAEANAQVRIFARQLDDDGNPINPTDFLLIGQGVVGSDESDDPMDNMPDDNLGLWEVTVEPLADGRYEIVVELEDKYGNISDLSNPLEIEIDTEAPNTPYLDLIADSDSGRNDEDNVTNINTLTFTMTTQDRTTNPDEYDHLFDTNFKFRLFVRPEAAATGVTGEELLIYDSATDGAIGDLTDGLTAMNFLERTLGALPDGYHNFKLEVEDRAGNISEDFLLDVIIDTEAYQGDGNLAIDSDSGIWGYGATFEDLITEDHVPSFYGVAEANNIVTVLIDGVAAGTTVAIPLDGNDAFQPPNAPYEGVEANWMLDSVLNLADGLHEAVFFFEDLAGNRADTATDPGPLQFFVDTEGPVIDNVTFGAISVDGVDDFDGITSLFEPKPAGGPDPLVHSIVVHYSDGPDRVDPFLYDPVFQALAEEEGNYSLIGDANGNIPIVDVNRIDVFTGPGRATAQYELIFAAPLPDDRFTFTVSDSIKDIAGNSLDGESGAAAPFDGNDVPNPTPPIFPTGDGEHGGDFVSRFTIDSRAELGVWGAGSVWVDTNGNFYFDPTNTDYVNRDIVYTMGVTSDDVFAGNFSGPGPDGVFGTPDDNDDASIAGNAVADGFDKLAAWGDIGVGGALTFDFRWLVDWDNDGRPDIRVDDPNVVDGYPVAGNFDGADLNGDEVALFTGGGLTGGGTWYFDTNHDFMLDTQVVIPGMIGLPIIGDFNNDGLDDLGTWSNDFFHISLADTPGGVGPLSWDSTPVSFRFGFIGQRERPIAADFDADGYDDIGLWVPDRAGATPEEAAEWYILVSGGQSVLDRIEIEPLTGEPIVEFIPDPFGEDIYAKFGDDFAKPVVGNFDPPSNPDGQEEEYIHQNPDNRFDVNDDGFISPADVLMGINDLNANTARMLNFPNTDEPFYDVSGDGYHSPSDPLAVINYLNNPANPAEAGEGEGPTTAPQAGSFAATPVTVDPVTEELGAEPSNDLLDLSWLGRRSGVSISAASEEADQQASVRRETPVVSTPAVDPSLNRLAPRTGVPTDSDRLEAVNEVLEDSLQLEAILNDIAADVTERRSN